MRINKKAALAVVGLSAVLLSGNALATVQTLIGTNVTYVYEDTLMGLYGQPILSGDSLIFTPTNFQALSTNGGIVQTSSTINVKVYANANYNLSAFNLTELGDYSLIGSDAQVAVGGQIRLFDLANPPPPATNQLTDWITATAPLTVTTTLANYQTTNWEANAAIAVPTNWSNGVNLTIENILLAGTTQVGSAAFIEKKFDGNSVIITAVPEAQTYAMMLAGLGLVGFMARRARMIV